MDDCRMLSTKLSKNDEIFDSMKAKKTVLSPLYLISYKILIVDGNEVTLKINKNASGKDLFDEVVKHLNLLEKDYFGLSFIDRDGYKNWLKSDKKVLKQIKKPPVHIRFEIKFYPSDPEALQEDVTRYYLCAQIRSDITCGKLQCSPVMQATLGSYMIQAQLGDFEDNFGPDSDPVSSSTISQFKFGPRNSIDVVRRACDLYKLHRGQTPSEAESNYLDHAKKLAFYGVHMVQAKDPDNHDVNLAVCSSGLLVFKDRLRISRYAWPRILQISYRLNHFYVKLRPGDFEQRDTNVGFKFSSSKSAKRFWKTCVENHAFFRLVTPETIPKRGVLNPFGSRRFRFGGRTLYQSRMASASIKRPEPTLQRSVSSRLPVKILDHYSTVVNQRLMQSKNLEESNNPGSIIKGVQMLRYQKSPDDDKAGTSAQISAITVSRTESEDCTTISKHETRKRHEEDTVTAKEEKTILKREKEQDMGKLNDHSQKTRDQEILIFDTPKIMKDLVSMENILDDSPLACPGTIELNLDDFSTLINEPYSTPKQEVLTAKTPNTVTTVITDEESVQDVPTRETVTHGENGTITLTKTAGMVKTVKQTIQKTSFEKFSVPASRLNESFQQERLLKTQQLADKDDTQLQFGVISNHLENQPQILSTHLDSIRLSNSNDRFLIDPPSNGFSQHHLNGGSFENQHFDVTNDLDTYVTKDVDYDKQLSDAIMKATRMNPFAEVRQIEVRRN